MWVVKEKWLETIKRTLFDAGTISSDRLDPDHIATLNESNFDDATWFCLVKRAAAEWQLDRDYQKPGQEKPKTPKPKEPKSKDSATVGDKSRKKGKSLQAKDKQGPERSIDQEVSKIA